MHRFYVPDFQALSLSTEEAHHAAHVLRLKKGDTVNVFDGRGHEAQCTIAELTGDVVQLRKLTEMTTQPLRCRITLAQAIPKKNMDLIVQKATELGVAQIQPLVSERTLVQIDEDAKKLDRWRNIALEACKQSGNNWLPEVLPPKKAGAYLASLPAFQLKLIASLQPDSKPLKQLLPEPAPASVLILVGPEGDFTPAELSSAKGAGCLPLSLGPLVLRAETAALYVMSILHHELQN